MASAPPDADDIAKLWIDTGLGDALTAEHVYSIPIGKPRDFFRTHPDSAYRARTEIYVQKSENVIGEQFYLIGPSMRGRIDEARPCILCALSIALALLGCGQSCCPKPGPYHNHL